ncbi:tyrosine--tRNA ligase [Helicobacter pylori]|uniref:tyrosine--tRNA ligase n=1 Tax=Helicobacter pylori TaxID=210 RepID=UPI00025ACAFC|nr:tyrosine--tRNA ligase [Helicobacter pylori]EIE29834.1 tyrosyl-tRNA synthetase [Helicobacter pylori NCTC 11637 = CCUG 17874 = ATCC 43504 = JCM 12093]MBM0602052.1 tyrosine--tRNA ligase [Helicobacter pylori]MBM0609441.1 tyrosine--tRNA ligase [Helicobacter pylori]MBM0618647.1 tyrosine--tRNA ligase [Helicobacter pylori]MBM0625905.1 tyrosine--tRNA ligase [Helicobacter pylori]
MEQKISTALKEIKRGANEIIGLEYIEKLVRKYYETNERFIVKAGFDPTAPDLHLGHTVLIQKLALLQQYGARVKFLIGDFTAMIGDPTGKNETRKPLNREQVLENAKTYEEQIYKILDQQHTEVCFNSTWLDALGTKGMIELCAKFSVARMLERDDFTKRYKENRPISIVEFLYPLLQGYDSVAMDADIELGGNDQKFNLLVGRFLQRAYGLNKEQSVITMPLLEGLDGVQKMSKSLGNYVGITEEPNAMFGKIMSVSDDLMWRYYTLLSAKTLEEIEDLKHGILNQTLHPKAVKEDLAGEIVARYYDNDQAIKAKEQFSKVFSANLLPEILSESDFDEGVGILDVLKQIGFCPSTSQARRDIQGGGVKINQEVVKDESYRFVKGNYVIQLGKKRFMKLNIN